MRTVEEILSGLTDILENAHSVPFKQGMIFVNVEEMSELLDELRKNLPQEIHKAKAILSDHDRYIAEGKKGAEEIEARAKERAKALVNQEAIYKEAKAKAEQVLAAAEQQANELLRGTFQFCDSVLLESENTVNQNLERVRQARKNLRTAARERVESNKAASRQQTAPDAENQGEE